MTRRKMSEKLYPTSDGRTVTHLEAANEGLEWHAHAKEGDDQPFEAWFPKGTDHIHVALPWLLEHYPVRQ